MMIDTQPKVHDIVTKLEALTNKLKDTTDDAERRALLKRFRELLDGADRLIARYPPSD
jgi:hypothetical protein